VASFIACTPAQLRAWFTSWIICLSNATVCTDADIADPATTDSGAAAAAKAGVIAIGSTVIAAAAPQRCNDPLM